MANDIRKQGEEKVILRLCTSVKVFIDWKTNDCFNEVD